MPQATCAAEPSGAATDDLDRIIHETDTGKVYFNKDGAAGDAKVHFATIRPNLAVTNAGFLVF
jgi:Ca2+-binding RTX toxin-like protein